MQRVRLRKTVWVAICAILLNTFAPLVSNSLAAYRAKASHHHCDDKQLAAEHHHSTTQHDPSQPHSDHLGHCPYCAPHGASFAAPPAAPLDFALVARPGLRVQVALELASSAEAWTKAQPRAPPAVS